MFHTIFLITILCFLSIVKDVKSTCSLSSLVTNEGHYVTLYNGVLNQTQRIHFAIN